MMLGRGFLVGDDKGNVVVMNPQARGALRSKDVAAFDTEILEAALGASLTTIMHRMQAGSVDRIATEADISGNPYHVSALPVSDASGKVPGVAIVLRDLSGEAQRESRGIGFVSVVSHELLTPLTSVKSAITTVLRGKAGGVTQEQEKFLALAERNVDRMEAIVKDLVDFAKLDTGKLEIEYKTMDLIVAIDSVVSSLKPQADEKSISIAAKVAEDIPAIKGDERRIEQIVTNLVGNAIKFTHRGGRISVAARVIKSADIGRISNIERFPPTQEDLIEVTVEDTGIGIPPEKVGSIFDEFYQAGSPTGQENRGMGLGLSITKKLVEAHQGRIWVESKVGKGSTFTCVFPLIEGDRRDKGFRRVLNLMFERAKQGESVLSLIMIRIDNYEKIVAVFGESAGFRVLESARATVEKLLYRTTDSAVRHKKGDMVIVLVEANREGSMVVRKRLEETLNRLTVNAREESVELEVRTGMATYPDDASNQRELYEKARENLQGGS